MKYFQISGNVAFLGVGVCAGPAQELVGVPANEKGEQVAVGVARAEIEGEPVLVVTFVLGATQYTATFDAAQSDKLCHLLSDVVLWQNDQLRRKAGQAVH